ncbi:MAG TPA: molybdopterin converting factor subunit 1 [Pyrinomonadaceae bacterium]|jgi:molybdopterin synthase catalytic subunit
MSSPGNEPTRQTNDSPQTIRVRLLYFGAAREEVGREEEQLEVTSPATSASVLAEVLNAHPALRRFGRSLLVAVNEEYAGASARVEAGDEVAIFPPVSGGAGGREGEGVGGGVEAGEREACAAEDFFELTTDPINVGAVARRVVPPACGATVTLDGYVRRFTRGREATLYLIYEAYAPMALSEMRRLGRQIHERFEVAHVGIVHRTGRLEIGETSVVISVSAPHRRAAFEACEWAIRELKRTVPIWKKEFFAGGEVWIEGEGAPVN